MTLVNDNGNGTHNRIYIDVLDFKTIFSCDDYSRYEMELLIPITVNTDFLPQLHYLQTNMANNNFYMLTLDRILNLLWPHRWAVHNEYCNISFTKLIVKKTDFYPAPMLDGIKLYIEGYIKDQEPTTDKFYKENKTMMNNENETKITQEEHINNANRQLGALRISKVIFNDNATIVFFDHGNKVVVKKSEVDAYSKEAAVALAWMKYKVGSEYFHYVLHALVGDKGSHFVYDATYSTKTLDVIDMNEVKK